jgi:hypothetical protein
MNIPQNWGHLIRAMERLGWTINEAHEVIWITIPDLVTRGFASSAQGLEEARDFYQRHAQISTIPHPPLEEKPTRPSGLTPLCMLCHHPQTHRCRVCQACLCNSHATILDGRAYCPSHAKKKRQRFFWWVVVLMCHVVVCTGASQGTLHLASMGDNFVYLLVALPFYIVAAIKLS